MRLRRIRFLAALALGCLAVNASPLAIAKIPNEILKAASPLTAEQQKAVDTEVSRLMDQLTAEDDDRVVAARGELLEPLQLGGSESFNAAYAASLARHLSIPLASDRPIARINAMVIARSIKDPGVVIVARTVLTRDENAAVRYGAARAINVALAPDATGKISLSELQQKELLADLKKVLTKESSPEVIRQILTAVAKLTIPDAAKTLFDALNQRVAMHARDPASSIRPEIDALRELHRKIVSQRAVNKSSVDDATLKAMALTAFRYLVLSGTALADSKLSPDRAGEYWTMIESADYSLRYAAGELAPSAKKPADIKEQIPLRRVNEINLRNEAWRPILEASPFSFKPEELRVAEK